MSAHGPSRSLRFRGGSSLAERRRASPKTAAIFANSDGWNWRAPSSIQGPAPSAAVAPVPTANVAARRTSEKRYAGIASHSKHAGRTRVTTVNTAREMPSQASCRSHAFSVTSLGTFSTPAEKIIASPKAVSASARVTSAGSRAHIRYQCMGSVRTVTAG